MASPERRLPHPCLKTSWPGPCRNCHAPGATHSPVFHRGIYCGACCPCCSPTAPKPPRAPTPGPRPPEPPKPAPRRMAPGSSFLDLGYGRRMIRFTATCRPIKPGAAGLIVTSRGFRPSQVVRRAAVAGRVVEFVNLQIEKEKAK